MTDNRLRDDRFDNRTRFEVFEANKQDKSTFGFLAFTSIFAGFVFIMNCCF